VICATVWLPVCDICRYGYSQVQIIDAHRAPLRVRSIRFSRIASELKRHPEFQLQFSEGF